MPNEPQSYGGQADWVAGNVGEEVNRQKPGGAGENRRESEHSAPHQGGHTPAHQMEQQAMPVEACDVFDTGDEGAKKVAIAAGGATRDGYFKDRDYR